MSLPVLSLNVKTPIVLMAGAADDNQISLTGGKYVFDLTANAEVTVAVYGPFPNGIVDTTQKAGLGKLVLCGTDVAVGKTLPAVGSYLVEVSSVAGGTANLLVRPWAGLWDAILAYTWWKLFRPSSC